MEKFSSTKPILGAKNVRYHYPKISTDSSAGVRTWNGFHIKFHKGLNKAYFREPRNPQQGNQQHPPHGKFVSHPNLAKLLLRV